MTPLNYLRSAIPDALLSASYYGKETPEYVNKVREILDSAKSAPKFVLPDNGKVFDDAFRGLPDDFRLPYPSIVIEYVCRLEGGLVEDKFGSDATHAAPERIIYAQQTEDNSILVASVICIHARGRKFWTMQPFLAEIIPRAQLSEVDKAQLRTHSFVDGHTEISQAATVMHDLGGRAIKDFGSKWEEHAFYDMNDECNAVLELIEALSCSNVSHEALPVRKQNKSAAKRGALPFDEYRVLTVRSSVAGKDGIPVVLPLDRRTPREHLRRGHVRVLKDSRRIWVNSTVVNANVGARITKDYRMVA